MTIDVFAFCDFAQDNNGKFTVIGTFNMLNVSNLPTFHQNFYLALKMTFSPEESGEHTIKFTFNEVVSGEPLLPPLEFKTNVKSNNGRSVSVNFPINAPVIRVEKEGTYIGSLFVDGNLVQSTELYVQKITN